MGRNFFQGISGGGGSWPPFPPESATDTKKSMCMCFTPILINFVKQSFMLNNNVIPYVENCKYLGICHSPVIHRKFSMWSYQVKCHLFRSYCANMANMHCSYFWFNNKLQICYNNSLRRLLSIPKRSSASEMFVNLNIPVFCELMRKCVLGFCFRLDNCKVNNSIRSFTRSSVIYNSKCWQWWCKVLHWYALLYWLYYLHNFNMVLVLLSCLCAMTVCIMFYKFVYSCCLRMYNCVIVVVLCRSIWMLWIHEINYQ